MFWNRTWLLVVGAFLAFNLLLFNHGVSLWDDDEAAYAIQTVNISSFAGQTVRIRFQAADAATASLVEAAVDNVTITSP